MAVSMSIRLFLPPFMSLLELFHLFELLLFFVFLVCVVAMLSEEESQRLPFLVRICIFVFS